MNSSLPQILLYYGQKEFVDKLLMMDLGILDGEMYSHGSPDKVAVDHLYLILSVAHTSALPDELQHHLNVLHV